MLVISGVPGSGKSHYAAHLSSQGWRWINHDDAAGGRPVVDELEHLWLGIRLDALPETVAELVVAAPAHTVVEYGFPVALLPVIVAFQRAGAATWWFSGDEAACLRAWRDEHKIPDTVWHTQVDAITREWSNIAEVYGDHILATRLHDRPLTTDEIDAVIKP